MRKFDASAIFRRIAAVILLAFIAGGCDKPPDLLPMPKMDPLGEALHGRATGAA